MAPRILSNFDHLAARSQAPLLAQERPILADYEPRDAVEENRAAAHGAGRQGRVDRALAVDLRRSPAGVLQSVHLAVEHRAPALHPPIVAASEDATVVHQHRADGDTALGQTTLGLFDRDSKELVHVRSRPRAPSATRLLYPADPGSSPAAPPVRGTMRSGATDQVTDSP